MGIKLVLSVRLKSVSVIPAFLEAAVIYNLDGIFSAFSSRSVREGNYGEEGKEEREDHYQGYCFTYNIFHFSVLLSYAPHFKRRARIAVKKLSLPLRFER